MPPLLILLAVLTAVAFQAPAQEPASPPAVPTPHAVDPVQTEALLDGVVLALQNEHRLAGLAVSVVRDDALLLAKGYGLADIAENRPVDPETTLFRIGSVSKTFTWTAVMMLAERGLLDLDADVNTYLREVGSPRPSISP
jgi:CubicO group peptidase (beta-lactamase class C family)